MQLNKYALAKATSQRLIDAQIPFGVFSGAHAALLGGHRQSPDIDFWFECNDSVIERVLPLFPDALICDRRPHATTNRHVSDSYDGVSIKITGGHMPVELMAGTVIVAGGVSYPSNFTEHVRRRVRRMDLDGLDTYFVDPVDTLLFKAISQRPPSTGKHDHADILAIAHTVSIDIDYLLIRTIETCSWNRVVPFLIELNVISTQQVSTWLMHQADAAIPIRSSDP